MPTKFREFFHFETPDEGNLGGGTPAPVPGTGEVPADPAAAPAAEPNNTEELQRDLGPIPYSRFREVNERRRELENLVQPYVDLEAAGYGVDDLHRLTAWEREFQQDPVNVWLRQAQAIENLPDPVKAAIASLADGGDGPKESPGAATPAPPANPTDLTPKPDGDEPPSWAKPLIEDYQSRTQREQQDAITGTLSAITHTWGELDSQAGIKPPSEAAMLRYIQTSEGSTPAEILRSARSAWLADRDEMLASEIKPPGGDGSTVPRSVPGSGAGSSSAPPVVARSLREATRNALASTPELGS